MAPSLGFDGRTLVVRIPIGFQRRGGRKRIVAPGGSEIVPATKLQPGGPLVKALARAWRWPKLLDHGVYTSAIESSEAEGIGKSCVSRILRLTLLAPDLVEAVLDGRLPKGVRLEDPVRPLPAEVTPQADRGALPLGSEGGGRHCGM